MSEVPLWGQSADLLEVFELNDLPFGIRDRFPGTLPCFKVSG